MSSAPGFLISAKNFYLTYPHLEASPQEVEHAFRHSCQFTNGKDFLLTVGCEYTHVDNATALESYDSDTGYSPEDNFHVHALLRFSRKQTCRSPFAFDILGKHGNYQCAYDVDAIHAYIHKDEGGDSLQWTGCGDGVSVCHLCEGAPGKEGHGRQVGWGTLLDKAKSRYCPTYLLLCHELQGLM